MQHITYGSLVREYRKNYGTSASSQPFLPAASQSASPSEQPGPQRSIIYCVHGQLADSCCELPNELSIRKIDCKELTVNLGWFGISCVCVYVSHCHKPRQEGIDKIARKKLMLASVLCVIFMIAEIIGGIYSNSLAIATDAAHLMADLASFMISLLALWIAARPSTKRMGATLHNHGHSHAGGGHHEEENINVRAAFIHVLSDFVQSLGVFIAALVIYFKPDWNIIDPICTFVFSLLVLATTIAIMRDAIVVLMEGTPKYLDYTEVMQTFLQIEGVVRVHNLRIWALSINKIALAAHLAVEPNTNTELVLREATQTVHAKYKFFETTLQIEEFQPDMEDCNQCSNPI
uniref:Cation efflux protein cytoplasmic domain-containing protein n=1 Tax=Anopheles stephensi TaxID=30069 RepID=A0A182YFT3_ANOST